MNGIRVGLVTGIAIGLLAIGGAGATGSAPTEPPAAAAASGTFKVQKTASILKRARAIPTKSGRFARIMLFTQRAKRVLITIDGSPERKMTKLGRGCSGGSCQKWRIYARRSGKECYSLRPTAFHRMGWSTSRKLDACEPFRQGRV